MSEQLIPAHRIVGRMLNRDEKASIAHALMHLNANRIHLNDSFGGTWYCGNREQFLKRHIKAIKLLDSLLKPPNNQRKVSHDHHSNRKNTNRL